MFWVSEIQVYKRKIYKILNAQISVHAIEVLSPSIVYFFSLFFFSQTDLKHKQRYYTRYQLFFWKEKILYFD